MILCAVNVTENRKGNQDCTIQKPSKKEFENIKGVIRIRKSKKDRYKRTHNDLQNTTEKTKDRATRTPLKTEMTSGAPEG